MWQQEDFSDLGESCTIGVRGEEALGCQRVSGVNERYGNGNNEHRLHFQDRKVERKACSRESLEDSRGLSMFKC